MEIMDKKRLVKLVSYLAMGDGGVYRNARCKNCIFSMSMIEDNIDFIHYTKSIMDNITSSTITMCTREPPRKTLVKLFTVTHPFFNAIRDRIYVGQYKSIDVHALKMLDYESLAILYMSDGCLGKFWRKGYEKYSYTLTLNMCRLSYGDYFILKKALKERLDLEFNIVKTGGKYYNLRLRAKDLSKFMNGIEPFMLDSFKYKLISERLAPIKGDDIV